jgi:hypothetical protein
MTPSHLLTIKFFPSADRVAIAMSSQGSEADQDGYFGKFFRKGPATIALARAAGSADEADRILTEDFIEGSGIRWLVTDLVGEPTERNEELDYEIAFSELVLKRSKSQ